MQEKPLVLILCTGNSCRSHLAEGILQQKVGDLIRVESAGSKPAGFVHPLAIRAMEEIGIDISDHRSKHLEELLDQKVHTVVTVCGYADQACPIFPGMVKRYHWGFDDPAKATGSEEEVFAVFRRRRLSLSPSEQPPNSWIRGQIAPVHSVRRIWDEEFFPTSPPPIG